MMAFHGMTCLQPASLLNSVVLLQKQVFGFKAGIGKALPPTGHATDGSPSLTLIPA